MNPTQAPAERTYTREQVIEAAQAVGVPDLWLACLTDLAFEYLGKMLTAAIAQPEQNEKVVAWAVISRDGSVHSTKTNRESAERCADRWRAKQAENGRDGWVCGVKPLTFATAPQPAPVAPDGFAIVPVEPTIGMLIAGMEHRISDEQPTHEHAVWAAMIAASQAEREKGGAQ